MRVELDGAARRVGDLDLAQRREELLPVLDVAADGLGRLVDPARRSCSMVSEKYDGTLPYFFRYSVTNRLLTGVSRAAL